MNTLLGKLWLKEQSDSLFIVLSIGCFCLISPRAVAQINPNNTANGVINPSERETLPPQDITPSNPIPPLPTTPPSPTQPENYGSLVSGVSEKRVVLQQVGAETKDGKILTCNISITYRFLSSEFSDRPKINDFSIY